MGYDENQTQIIRWIYLGAIIIWVVICYLLGLFPVSGLIETCILLVPIIVFLLAWIYVDRVTDTVENFVGSTNVLTLGLIIAMPLMNWVNGQWGERKQFSEILATAIILSLLTLIDFWVPHDSICIVRHMESAMQTMAIALLIFGLYRFFIEGPHFNIPPMILGQQI